MSRRDIPTHLLTRSAFEPHGAQRTRTSKPFAALCSVWLLCIRLNDGIVPSPSLDLRQCGKGRRIVLVLDELPDFQPAHRAGRHVNRLTVPRFYKGRSDPGAVREPNGASFPPVVVGKVRPQREYQPVDGHVPAKLQGQLDRKSVV